MNGQNHSGFRMAFVFGLIGWLGTTVLAGAEAVQQKLKPEVSIKLENVTIAEALDRISRQTGIQIKLSDDAVWKLPEGRDTRLSVTLEGPLAGSLEQMLNNFFLRYAVGSESLTVYPRPELRHILGRPTVRSLKLLKNVYASRVTITARMVDAAMAQRLLNSCAGEPITVTPTNQFENVTRILDKTARRADRSDVISSNAPPTPVMLASVLDDTVASLDGFHDWCISLSEIPDQVPQIMIARADEFSKMRLRQVVDVSFMHEEGEKVIRALAARADMDVKIANSAAVRHLANTISLEVQNVALETALEKASAALGVYATFQLTECVMTVQCVDVPVKATPTPAPGQAETAVSRADAYVGKISIPMEGGKYFIEFMLRESDLTDELRQLRSEKIRGILKGSSASDANTPGGQVGR
jgi:hypothetical protein